MTSYTLGVASIKGAKKCLCIRVWLTPIRMVHPGTPLSSGGHTIIIVDKIVADSWSSEQRLALLLSTMLHTKVFLTLHNTCTSVSHEVLAEAASKG